MADTNFVDERLCNIKHRANSEKVDLAMEKIDVRLDAMDEALVLRTGELEKRLEGLNQLRADVVKDREQYLRQEVYNIKTAQYDSWITNVNNRLTIIETRAIVWTGALAVIFIIVQLLLHYLNIVK